ncbi:tudor and KH domain-containing protein [Sphaerodactylus townsendi]|uniref:tudor and KH domain-containing protein n=1 Tax=Sphaerodactylus townsendi TaxID=933632 RepID=UPI002025B90D|nr:tudor and KH domain-containing protein [Sphaerodactylus townsendi]
MSSEQSSWSSLTTLQKVALALGIPAGGAILYILYHRYRESREERVTFVGEEIQVEMTVPKDAVKLLIGRQGATIKQLRKNTRARIDVDLDVSDEDKRILIFGSPVQVCKAKAAIHQILADNLPVEEKMHVPHRAVGRIIGRGGETVRSICRSTGAQVNCDRQDGANFSLTRLITISGTRKEVKAAKEGYHTASLPL